MSASFFSPVGMRKEWGAEVAGCDRVKGELPPRSNAPSSYLPPSPSRSAVVTFYSSKAGVGRSTALANIAVLLAKWQKRVLLVDWDLDAPGLERFFQRIPSAVKGDRKVLPGVVDLMLGLQEGQRGDWRQCLIELRPHPAGIPIHLISAGRNDGSYAQRAANVRWKELRSSGALAEYVRELREQWTSQYDYVLVDGRSGFGDAEGACTALLADYLMLFVAASEQSAEGAQAVMQQASEIRRQQRPDLAHLIALPLLAMDERDRDHERSRDWQHKVAKRFGQVFSQWLPSDVTPLQALQKLYIPALPQLSFGEPLPVVESANEIGDPRSGSSAFARLARLVTHHCEWRVLDATADAGELSETRSRFLDAQRRAAAAEEIAAKRKIWMIAFGVAAGIAALIATIGLSRATSLSHEVESQREEAQRLVTAAANAKKKERAAELSALQARIAELRFRVEGFAAHTLSLEQVRKNSIEEAIDNGEELRLQLRELRGYMKEVEGYFSSLSPKNPARANLSAEYKALQARLDRAETELKRYDAAVGEVVDAAPSGAKRGLGAALNEWRAGLRAKRRGKEQEAAEHFRNALKIQDRFAPGYHALGRIALERGQLDTAEKLFQTAIKRNPSYVAALGAMARLSLKRGDRRQAENYAAQALRLRSSYLPAQRVLQELRSKPAG